MPDRAKATDPAGSRVVAYVTHSPFVSGAERSLLRTVSALAQSGYSPVVISGHGGDMLGAVSTAGVPHGHVALPLPKRSWPFPWVIAIARLVSELRRRHAVLVHVNDAPAAQHAAVAARILRLPLVCHLRFTYGAEGLRWYLRYGFQRAIFSSEFMKRYAQSQCPDVFPDDRCVVIHNGFDPPAPPAPLRLAQLREELRLVLGDRVIGFIGQVVEVKGVREFLLAAAQLLQRDSGCRFLIIGDDLQAGPSYRLKMEELAGALGIASACRFTRFRDDVWALLHLCDVVLVPSHVEPFGNVALEAGGAGRPVIASRVGGLPEIVRHEETGLLVPPNDAHALANAAAQLLSDPERRRSFGMAARQRVLDHFGLARSARQLVDLYNELLAPGVRQRSGPRNRRPPADLTPLSQA